MARSTAVATASFRCRSHRPHPYVASDEAWSRRVGNVSPQHVGRLRRTYEQFGQTHDRYHGLYWSHFQAALDWDDAEMWLEGAVQSGWSVAKMRNQRWESMGAPANAIPRDEEVISAERDEDMEPANDSFDGPVGASLREVYSPEAEPSADSAAPEDAFLVKQLRAAGAVILGKTNLSEWANFRGKPSISGWSSRGGLTRNPYALDRSACGSSSGSGAAVAANLCAAAAADSSHPIWSRARRRKARHSAA